MTTTETTWDITPADPDYSGPRISLASRGGGVWVARADDPRTDPWVLVPVALLRYIDQHAIKTDYNRAIAEAYNSALEAAFPGGPPGGCGGYIDIDAPDIDPFCAVHGGRQLPCTCRS
jgi:hypothetical protein